MSPGRAWPARFVRDDPAKPVFSAGRAGNADDVASAAAFLASEYDGFITGGTLDINGGVYAC